ncbi:hypothetical protein GCM10010510_25770 [Streptomyces anandii JCM 4720]|nr:DUF4267 domain-containing protein [Streptomyces anandii]GGX79604.1 hypothetical protein GCM10010510_25770 [Streptomyces anandii JCM 4720]
MLLVEALAAYGDMATVLAHHGSVPTALGVHGLTATLMVVNGLLMMRETRKVTAAPVTPAPQPVRAAGPAYPRKTIGSLSLGDLPPRRA